MDDVEGKVSARSRPRTCRPPRRSSPTTSAPTAGTRCPTSPTRSTRSPRSTAAPSTSPAAAARPSTPPSRSRVSTARCCSARCSRWSSCLLLTYRSPVLWILPIFSVMVALGTSLGLIYFLAKDADLTVNGQSQAIVSILVIGAGTDYALLLVARYREELRRHEDRHEAMAFALHRATPAIIASAAHGHRGHALPDPRRDELDGRARARSCAIGVGVTLLAMITLLPALLVIFGRWMFWPKRPTFGSAEPTSTGIWARVGALHHAPAAPGVGRHHARSWRARRPRRADPQHERALDRGVLHQGVRLGEGPEGAHRARPGRQLHARDGGRQRRQGRRRRRGDDAASTTSSTAAEPVVKDGVAFITANLTVDSTTTAAFDTVDEVRTAVHAVDGADALVGGQLGDLRRHAQGQRPRLQGDHPGDPARGAADPDAAAAGPASHR